MRQEPGSEFGVEFPDVPGCVTAGSTLDEAWAMAHDALALHVSGLLEDGDKLPVPTRLPSLETEDMVAVLLIGIDPREERGKA